MSDGRLNEEVQKVEPTPEVKEKVEDPRSTQTTLFEDTITAPSKTRTTKDYELPSVLDLTTTVDGLVDDTAAARQAERLERFTAENAAKAAENLLFSIPLRADTLSSFFQGDTKTGMYSDARFNIFEAGVHRNPFDSGSTSSPYFRGFNFSGLGESVTSMALRGAGTALDGLIKNNTFDFDGFLNSDFFKGTKPAEKPAESGKSPEKSEKPEKPEKEEQKPDQSDKPKASEAKTFFGFTNLNLEQVGKGLSDFFYGSKDGSKDSKDSAKASGLVESAVESVIRVGSSVIRGASHLLDMINPSAEKGGEKGSEKPTDGAEQQQDGDHPRPRKLADGTVVHNVKTPDGGSLQVRAGERQGVIDSTSHGHIEQGRGGPGPHDVKVRTTDGREFHQGEDGRREMSNPRSDFSVEQDGEKVRIKDKNGHQVAEFGSLGDARKFLDNSDFNLTRPGETVEQAAERIKREDPKKWDDNNHIISDGRGNVLTVDEDGNRLRRHPDGKIEMQYKKNDGKGNETTVDVRISQRRGRTVVAIRGQDGEFHETDDLTDREIRDRLRGSSLSWEGHENGGLHRRRGGRYHRATPDAENPEKPQDKPQGQTPPETQPVIGTNGEVRATDNTTINPETGDVTTREGEREVKVHSDPQGQTTISDTAGPTITRDPEGQFAVQGKEPDDRVTFNPASRVLDAWGIRTSPEGTRINNDDGSHTDIDERGNFTLIDQFGETILQAIANSYKFGDGFEINEDNDICECEDELEEYIERMEMQQKEAARLDALHDAAAAAGLAAAISAAAAGVLSPGALGSLLAQLNDAASKCLSLNVPVPGEVFAAEAQLKNAEPKFDFQIGLQNKIYAELGTVNNALITYALGSGYEGSTAVDYANRLWSGHDSSADKAAKV